MQFEPGIQEVEVLPEKLQWNMHRTVPLVLQQFLIPYRKEAYLLKSFWHPQELMLTTLKELWNTPFPDVAPK